MRRLLGLSFILILLTACAPSKSTETQTGCQPSKIQKSKNEFIEIQGKMKSDGEIWALLFFETAHTAEARSEEGAIITPIWTEYHGGSNWQRPGQEWGSGFNFPTPGCWTITVTRGVTTGTISIDVLDP